ncbi:hypothetical protein SAMN04488556_3756 [Halostagnicola kamekurae]|uniref:Uncharacterized protein n=1 Tax=Halostagnicola kamekurae TaxID=619731 RepID=A0A1I6UCV1_9EURY|nr:hypothetical protein SAMN04488556_3756 [Halostagnicola kamekurae]
MATMGIPIPIVTTETLIRMALTQTLTVPMLTPILMDDRPVPSPCHY